MNVLLVSTWRQPCGLAEYTDQLVQALEKELGEGHVSVMPEEVTGKGAREGWSRKRPQRLWADVVGWCGRMARDGRRPDVVHFQHEYGLFPDSDSFTEACHKVAEIAKVVVTYHTVARGYRYSDGHTQIVHTLRGMVVLGPNSVCIPHGCREVPEYRQQEAKDQLRVKQPGRYKGGKPIVLVPGFLSKSKRVLETVTDVVPYSDAHWIFAGAPVDNGYTLGIMQFLKASGLNIYMDMRYVPDEDMDLYFRAADLVFLNRVEDTPCSASGQIATAMSYGKAILARDTNIHRDGAAILFEGESEAVELLPKVIACKDSLGKAARCLAKQRSWSKTASEHLQLYHG